MSGLLFWGVFGLFFAGVLGLIAWTSLRFGSSDAADLRSLKGRTLTASQMKKLRKLGLTDAEAREMLD